MAIWATLYTQNHNFVSIFCTTFFAKNASNTQNGLFNLTQRGRVPLSPVLSQHQIFCPFEVLCVAANRLIRILLACGHLSVCYCKKWHVSVNLNRFQGHFEVQVKIQASYNKVCEIIGESVTWNKSSLNFIILQFCFVSIHCVNIYLASFFFLTHFPIMSKGGTRPERYNKQTVH